MPTSDREIIDLTLAGICKAMDWPQAQVGEEDDRPYSDSPPSPYYSIHVWEHYFEVRKKNGEWLATTFSMFFADKREPDDVQEITLSHGPSLRDTLIRAALFIVSTAMEMRVQQNEAGLSPNIIPFPK